MQFQFGIEHEVAFLRSHNTFADFTNTSYKEFDAIINQLPEYLGDRNSLRIGDAGIRRKRWYIEGIERFDEQGNLVKCIPKGIEIRTTLHQTIQSALVELNTSFSQLIEIASKFGFTPIATSFNPIQTEFIPNPPLNVYECDRMNQCPEDRTEHLPMLTYGPDLNLSVIGATVAQTIDWAKKLTYYSPYLIPFSYSPCDYGGKPWPGKSVRTFYRTGARPAVLVFVENTTDLIICDPSLIKLTQKPSEWGRIEFKAFDSCIDFDRYGQLFTLLKGLILDTTLEGRSIVPDTLLHKHSAKYGWDSELIQNGSQLVLNASMTALDNDDDRVYLKQLEQMMPSSALQTRSVLSIPTQWQQQYKGDRLHSTSIPQSN